MRLFNPHYEVRFTNLNNEEVCHFVLKREDKFEAYHSGQSIGVYDTLIDAADAVRWLDNLIVWQPSVSERRLRH